METETEALPTGEFELTDEQQEAALPDREVRGAGTLCPLCGAVPDAVNEEPDPHTADHYSRTLYCPGCGVNFSATFKLKVVNVHPVAYRDPPEEGAAVLVETGRENGGMGRALECSTEGCGVTAYTGNGWEPGDSCPGRKHLEGE